jgi:hypothetical protein
MLKNTKISTGKSGTKKLNTKKATVIGFKSIASKKSSPKKKR